LVSLVGEGILADKVLDAAAIPQYQAAGELSISLVVIFGDISISDGINAFTAVIQILGITAQGRQHIAYLLQVTDLGRTGGKLRGFDEGVVLQGAVDTLLNVKDNGLCGAALYGQGVSTLAGEGIGSLSGSGMIEEQQEESCGYR